MPKNGSLLDVLMWVVGATLGLAQLFLLHSRGAAVLMLFATLLLAAISYYATIESCMNQSHEVFRKLWWHGGLKEIIKFLAALDALMLFLAVSTALGSYTVFWPGVIASIVALNVAALFSGLFAALRTHLDLVN